MRPSSMRKREAVLKAAERQFLATGYESVTMDSIAAESRVAKQTLYSHFGSKRALFLELVSTRTRDATRHVQETSPQVGPDAEPRTLLRDLLRAQLRTVLTPTLLGLRRLVIGELARSPELATALYEHGPGKAIEKLATTLRRFDELGKLRVPDPDLAASQLNWLVMGEPLNRAMLLGDGAARMDDAAIERHVEAALDVFLAAFAPSAG